MQDPNEFPTDPGLLGGGLSLPRILEQLVALSPEQPLMNLLVGPVLGVALAESFGALKGRLGARVARRNARAYFEDRKAPLNSSPPVRPMPPFWTNDQDVPRMIAVVSGKGGVGKSLLALALAEHFARLHETVLVDFDLHNRGLQSRFQTTETSTVFGEMQVFQERVMPQFLRQVTPARYQTSTDRASLLDESGFLGLREVYWGANPEQGKTGGRRRLDLSRIPATVLGKSEELNSRLWFMPSRRAGSSYLGSGPSQMNDFEVSLFLKYLASFCRVSGPARTVILDCHGAHDMHTLGALLAADHTVVVTVPEPGAFEGTAELLSLCSKMRDQKELRSLMLVINQYSPMDAFVAEKIRALFMESFGLQENHILQVQYHESIKGLLRGYRVGATRKLRRLAPVIDAIAGEILQGRRIGEILLGEGVLTRDTLQQLLKRQGRRLLPRRKLGELAIARGGATREQVESALLTQARERSRAG